MLGGGIVKNFCALEHNFCNSMTRHVSSQIPDLETVDVVARAIARLGGAATDVYGGMEEI
jgi:hypothetical protein